MVSKATLEYRATAAFYLDGVPHHCAGTWQASKKRAQRDAADRALGLFVGRWSEELMQQRPDVASGFVPEPSVGRGEEGAKGPEEQLLERFCEQLPACTGGPPQWIIEPQHPNAENGEMHSSGPCSAIVELQLLGVQHKLAGPVKPSEREARADTAVRTLWYLQCPGFEDAYEAEKLCNRYGSGKVPTGLGELPSPPCGWVCDDSSQEALDEAKRKTVAMRVQNRLQQEFARQLQPGQGVWEWSYAADQDDEQWPPLFRATVNVPVLGKSFVGDWVRGQRDAQINTIAQVSAFLDEMSCASNGQQKGKPVQRRGHNEIERPRLCSAPPLAGLKLEC
jgi:hypothetical protein